MSDFKENTDPSRQLLDQMMADCNLTAQQQEKMHQTLGGIFGSVALRRTREENIKMIRKNWENKAKYNNFSYRPLFEHESLDEYIAMRVDELLVRRKYQVEHLGHSP
jgi:hypothetical protein